MKERTSSSSSFEKSSGPDIDPTLSFLDDLSPQGWWDWRLQENWEYISPKYWHFLGYDPDKKRHSPKEWQAIIDPEDAKEWLEEYNRHIESAGENPPAVSKIVRYRRADGGTAYLVCQGKVIEWTPDGKPQRMIGTHTDITQTILDKNLLEEQSNLIEAAFEKSPHPCSIISMEGNFIKVNPSFCRIFGYTQEEFCGKTWMEITHPEDLQTSMDVLKRFISGEIRSIEIEKRFIQKNGTTVYTRVRGEILKPLNQSPYFLMHVTDLTLERELLQSIKRLSNIG